MTGLYYAVIQDDEGDATYGPPETRENADKRAEDAKSSGGSRIARTWIEPIK
jgi:hypothetical protein